MKTCRRSRLVFLATGLLAAAAGARTLVVMPAHPGAYRTIGEALEAASPGTVIQVYYFESSYRERLVIDKEVTIRGYHPDGWPLPVIESDFGQVGPVIEITGGAVIENLLVRRKLEWPVPPEAAYDDFPAVKLSGRGRCAGASCSTARPEC